ncbi:MAG: SBBP repeat-containing protein [Armatimonadetes bacterium]|nr:SBBP repeat-containing protein [Armatimonadota bacterium]
MIINGGQLNHSIVKGSDGSAISGVLAPGGSYTFQANSPGTYNFRCGIHPTETGVLFGSFPPPTISSISPLTGTAGSTLTINGTNFGAVQMGGTGVTIGNVNAQATVWSDTQIQCTVPFGTGATNGNVTVTVAGNPVTFSSPFAAKPVEDWTRTENNNAINDSDSANAIALDGSGNIYVAGSISNASGNPDIWVRKYDPSGNISWTKNQAGGANLDDEARAIAVDGSGNAYVVGVEYQTGSPQKEIWVRKYSSTGGVLWTDSYGGILNADDYGNGVAVDSAGNFYVAGGKSSGQGLNFSVRKYDFTGTVVWDQEYNGPDNIDDEATCVAVDGSQNVYVAGYETTSPSNWNDILVRKYDSSGTLLWTRTNSNMGEDRAKAIRVDASGNVYVAGYVTGSPTNVWVRKYDTNGNTLWTQTYDSPANSYDYGYGIAVDVFGNVYVTGDEERSDLGQGPNVWIRKFSPTGTPIWTETYNGGANMGDVGKAITVDANGNVFIAGQTLESLAQLSDIWVRKYKQ